jgi:HAD superfamily hydrolase (TIGR01509 family)
MLPWPRALLFDMDGLLLDSEPVWGRAEADLAKTLGVDWPEAEARRCIGIGLRETVVRIAHRANLRADVDVLVEGLIERFLARAGEVRPKPGAVELLDAAASRNVPIAVATSSPKRVAERALLGAGLLPRFTVICGGDEVAAPKPDPAVYVLAATRLGVVLHDSLVLEDSITGCRAGRLSGARVFAVPEPPIGERPFANLTDGVFEDLHEVQRRLGW